MKKNIWVLPTDKSRSEVGWGNPKELDNAKFDYEVENTNDILHLINQIKEILIKRNII